MITERLRHDAPMRRSAADLALLLRIARAHLATARPVVCPRCHHVFSRDQRLDMRCPGCAAKAADQEEILP